MYLIAIVVFLFIWAYQSYASRKYMRDAVANIPGPYAVPILGCVKFMREVNPKNILPKMLEFGSKYGSVFKLWGLNRIIILSTDTELNEQLLASNVHITKHRNYGILHQWLGTGLLMSDGKKWHSRRKIITPAFHFKILEDFLEVFDRQSSVLLDCLAERADGKTAFDIYPYMCLMTLDVIVETAMGTKVNAQTAKGMEYTSAVNEMTELMAWRFIRIHLNSEFTFTLFCPHKKLRQMKLIRIMKNFTKKVIEERRSILESNLRSGSTDPTDHDDIGSKKRSALLDVLLQSTIDGQPLSDEDIREEVDTFMFEGHDTTASALSFTLHLLARHPRVQDKLLAEIRQVYGSDNSTPFTLMNLNELKYTECVIRESLRLYPSVPIIARQIKEDFKYKHSRLGNGVIPAGAEFSISIYGTLLDATRYTNPYDFNPERYENIDANTTFSSIPFSAGPRNCIGQKFAMYEMKATLTKIIRKYELLPLGEAVQPIENIVLSSETGMQLGMKMRHL